MTIRSVLLPAAALLGLSLSASADVITGPSSSQSPYIVGTKPGVVVKSVLTVGDSVDGYRMVGIPDGLGAFDNGDETFTVLMNHELSGGNGITRAHGAIGAFISKWTIRKSDLTVTHGEDLIQDVATWNAAGFWNTPAQGVVFNRFCAADLAAPSAFYDAASGLGSTDRIFLNGEENGAEGRAFGHLLNGISYELPRLGKMSFENVVAHPNTGVKTVAVALDDGSPGGQVYVYAGTKTNTGNAVEKAGLANGSLYGIKVTGFPNELAAGIPSGTAFTTYSFGNVSSITGAALDAASIANNVTYFKRPEDGAWDPNNPTDFYFVTTDGPLPAGRSRLWMLRFNDPSDPAAGGKIYMLLNGTEGQFMLDNITVTDRGQVVMQEDPGNQDQLAKIWRYSIAKGTSEIIAQHDPNRFVPPTLPPFNRDEESSGIIPLKGILGESWFMLDVQAHYSIAGELVQGGQLLVLHFPPGWK